MLPSDLDGWSDKAQKRSSVSPPSQSGKPILSTSVNSSMKSKLPVNDISSGDIAPVARNKALQSVLKRMYKLNPQLKLYNTRVV